MPYPEDSLVTVEEFYMLGLPERALRNSIGAMGSENEYLVSAEALQANLCAVSQMAHSLLAGRGYPIPIPHPQLDLKRAVCRIVAWDILHTHRGADPETGGKAPYEEAQRCQEWLEKVARGEANLMGVSLAGSPEVKSRARVNLAMVITDDEPSRFPRGW